MTFKQLCTKSFLPLLWAGIFFPIAKELAFTGESINYMWVWIICGFPYALPKIWEVIKTKTFTTGEKIGISFLRLCSNCITGGFKFFWSIIKGIFYLFTYIFSTFFAPLLVKKMEKKMEEATGVSSSEDYQTVASNDSTVSFSDNQEKFSTESTEDVEKITVNEIYIAPSTTTNHKERDKDMIFLGDVDFEEVTQVVIDDKDPS